MIRPRLALAALCLSAGTLSAQVPSSTPEGVTAPGADTLMPFVRPPGASLRAGRWSYRLTRQENGAATPLGVRTVEVSETLLAGAPAWLIAEQRTGTVVPTSDSLWLARESLAPLRWLAAIDRTRLAASFTADSVFGALQSYRGRSSFASPVPSDALITPGMVERFVELLPIGSGYAASASLLLLDWGTPRVLPADLVVERDERIHAGGRDVECWVVALSAGSVSERLWVSKQDRRVVRTEQGTVVAESD
ncbi:MAG TPA: hypothetical protein VL328_05900 [Gemmatimonadaceae bacterium]|nr:hypothetical protein [Gemmatimonadaceae bacterium]